MEHWKVPIPDMKKGRREGALVLFASDRTDEEELLDRVVHVELNRVRRHVCALDFFHLQFDVSVDQVV